MVPPKVRGRGPDWPTRSPGPASPVPVQMWAAATVQMWQGVSPVPVQMWQGVSPVLVQMWQGLSPVLVHMW